MQRAACTVGDTGDIKTSAFSEDSMALSANEAKHPTGALTWLRHCAAVLLLPLVACSQSLAPQPSIQQEAARNVEANKKSALEREALHGDPMCGTKDLPIGNGASDECLTAVKGMVGKPDGPDLARPSLTACRDVLEWGYALRAWPAAMGLKDDAILKVNELEAACGKDRTMPVCRNAQGSGLIE